MKKGSKKFAAILSAAVLLMGCQNDTEPKPDITSGNEESTKFDISQPVTDLNIGEDDVTDSREDDVTESSEETDFIPKLLIRIHKQLGDKVRLFAAFRHVIFPAVCHVIFPYV